MKNTIKLIAICLFLFMAYTGNAQPGFDDDVVDTPIDGGISLLVGAGLAYGYRKFKNKKPTDNI